MDKIITKISKSWQDNETKKERKKDDKNDKQASLDSSFPNVNLLLYFFLNEPFHQSLKKSDYVCDQCDQKKLPIVYKSCPKMISLEK